MWDVSVTILSVPNFKANVSFESRNIMLADTDIRIPLDNTKYKLHAATKQTHT